MIFLIVIALCTWCAKFVNCFGFASQELIVWLEAINYIVVHLRYSFKSVYGNKSLISHGQLVRMSTHVYR